MDQSLFFNIKKQYSSLRKSERKVADYLLAFNGDTQVLTTSKIAKYADVSEPTIIRFARGVGFQNFKELKIALIEEKVKQNFDSSRPCDPFYGYQISKTDKIEDVPANIVAMTCRHLENTLQSIDVEALQETIEAIRGARRIILCGVENSVTTVHDLNLKLTYLGFHTCYYEDNYMKNVSISNCTKDDLVIGITYTGYTKETIHELCLARQRGVKTIAISNVRNSHVEDNADIVLYAAGEQYLYGKWVFSRSTQMAVVDMRSPRKTMAHKLTCILPSFFAQNF